MKKILLVSLIAIAPAIASAQTFLASGYNFGQFLGANDPSTDPSTFEDSGFIGANWAETSAGAALPPPGDSWGALGLYSPAYENNTGRVYWDGNAGSSSLLGSFSVTAFNNPSPSINADTVNGTNMALLGDHNGSNMGLLVNGAFSIGFQQNMTGLFEAGLNDLTFAAQAVSGPITIDWIFGGNTIATTNVTTAWQAFTVNLPTEFYGSISDLTASFSGSGRLDNVQFNAAIPEPSTYAAVLGVLTLGFAFLRRRRKAALEA